MSCKVSGLVTSSDVINIDQHISAFDWRPLRTQPLPLTPNNHLFHPVQMSSPEVCQTHRFITRRLSQTMGRKWWKQSLFHPHATHAKAADSRMIVRRTIPLLVSRRMTVLPFHISFPPSDEWGVSRSMFSGVVFQSETSVWQSPNDPVNHARFLCCYKRALIVPNELPLWIHKQKGRRETFRHRDKHSSSVWGFKWLPDLCVCVYMTGT